LVLLLSATINPGQVIMVKRKDPKRRLKDYLQALEKWSRVPAFDSIIFCENSGADISSLRKMAAHLPGAHERIRFISFQGNAFPPALGKGYGEMEILKHATSQLGLDRKILLIKATGRYVVRNIDDVLDHIHSHPEYEVYCNVDRDGVFASSAAFATSLDFLEKYLFPLHQRINDSVGVYFEHVLAQAIRTAAADGMRWTSWPGPLQLSGVSGTSNKAYGGPADKIAEFRMWLLERTYQIRRLLGLYRRGRKPAPHPLSD
jgi:hypothetical protein